MKKLRVGVIYGGRSGEHEVSLASAASVFQNLDPARYDAVAIRIEKDGRWTLPPEPPKVMKAADVIKGAVPAAAGRARSAPDGVSGRRHAADDRSDSRPTTTRARSRCRA